MDNEKLAFRTTAVGGFHKQDVILYIQTLSNHYTEQLGQLRAELDAEKAARLMAEELCMAGGQSVETDTGDAERLRSALDLQALEVGRLEAELRALTERLEAAERENAALKEKAEESKDESESVPALSAEAEREKAALLAQLEDSTRENAALKARVREAEGRAEALAARAANAEAEVQIMARQAAAAAAAAAFQTECDSHLTQIQARYARLRGDIEATVLRVTDELERVHAALSGAMAAFHEGDSQP